MKFSLKPSLTISHLLPGCFFLLLVLMGYAKWNFAMLKVVFGGIDSTGFIGIGIIGLILAFLVGEIADSVRDGIIESILDKFSSQVQWDYFYQQTDKRKLQRLEDYYFTWYIFNLNSSICLIFGGIVTLVDMGIGEIRWIYRIIWIIILVILIYDGIALRKDIARYTHSDIK